MRRSCALSMKGIFYPGSDRVVIVSGGSREMGGRGAALERSIVDISGKYGMRVIGPDCIGILNGENSFDSFFQPVEYHSSWRGRGPKNVDNENTGR